MEPGVFSSNYAKVKSNPKTQPPSLKSNPKTQPPPKSNPKTQPTHIVKLNLKSIVSIIVGWVLGLL